MMNWPSYSIQTPWSSSTWFTYFMIFIGISLPPQTAIRLLLAEWNTLIWTELEAVSKEDRRGLPTRSRGEKRRVTLQVENEEMKNDNKVLKREKENVEEKAERYQLRSRKNFDKNSKLIVRWQLF